MSLRKPEKILVLRFSSLGDILLTFPVYKALKKKFPYCEITALTKPQFAQIFHLNKYIDKVMVFKGLLTTLRKINSSGFDLLIDLHSNLRSRLISFLALTNLKIRYKKTISDK